MGTDGFGPRGKEARGEEEGQPHVFSPSLRALRKAPGKGKDPLKSYPLILGLSSLNNGMVIGLQ